MGVIHAVFIESWHLLEDAAVYILIGLWAGGLLKTFLSAEYVATHLGRGRLRSVLKAALFGIPLPLCSCSVLPAAAALKKHGASRGATAAFLVATPETGVDSISITWALLDPIMTVARPLAAFITAVTAGVTENLIHPPHQEVVADRGNATCGHGCGCTPKAEHDVGEHDPTKGIGGRLADSVRHAAGDLWEEIAAWFWLGILIAGMIGVFVPETMFSRYLGGGVSSMFLMLVIGIPVYICATASTPIAAAMILKGVSPGAALVFLLVGPATNITSLSVLIGLLGRWATVRYLAIIATVSVLCGLAVDEVYHLSGLHAQAVIGQAAEIMPPLVRTGAAVFLVLLSVRPMYRLVVGFLSRLTGRDGAKGETAGCGCGGGCSSGPVVESVPAAKERGGHGNGTR